MNSAKFIGLLTIVLISATYGTAQKIAFSKQLFVATGFKTQRHPKSLVREIPGVYIPPGTTLHALERQVFRILSENPALNIKPTEAHRIVYNHPNKRLNKLQVLLGKPLFGARPLSYKEGMEVLHNSQAQFATARTHNTYETAWEELITQHRSSSLNGGKSYLNEEDLALDVYYFHSKYLKGTSFHKIKIISTSSQEEGVVCEIPVNGLTVYDDSNAPISISPEHFVVIHMDNGTTQLVARQILEHQRDGKPLIFCVLQ